jgi:thiamine kinase-like enzyme
MILFSRFNGSLLFDYDYLINSKLLKSIKSPVVFCHHDFHPANLLKLTEDDTIVIIDYEYANYNFR